VTDSTPLKVIVPDSGDMAAVAAFSATLSQLAHHSNVEFSFRAVKFATPGWLLMIVRALRSFRQERPGTKCRVIDTSSKAMQYAGHAGFFDALDIPWAKRMGEAPTTSTFVPIKPRKVRELFSGQPLSRLAGDIIQDEAERLSALLAQSKHGVLFDTLSYSIREIIRNVVEHSKAEEYLFAAQCWVENGTAEIAVADAGIGIANGLRSNRNFEPADDAEALLLAIQPGVTGAIISSHMDDVWANSGFGLYMARGLADGKQGLFIASGNAALAAGHGQQATVPAAINGTCVALRIRSGDTSLEKRLQALVASAGGKPSAASMSVKVRS
jgi:hypothetical protein